MLALEFKASAAENETIKVVFHNDNLMPNLNFLVVALP